MSKTGQTKTDKQTDRPTYIHTDRQTDDRQTDRKIDSSQKKHEQNRPGVNFVKHFSSQMQLLSKLACPSLKSFLGESNSCE